MIEDISYSNIKELLDKTKKYNKEHENDKDEDDLNWMGTSLEALYQMAYDIEVKYKNNNQVKHNDYTEASKVVRVNRLVDKGWLEFNKINYVFMSGIYVPLEGLIMKTDVADSLLEGKPKLSSDEVNNFDKNYYVGAMQPLTTDTVFIPKKCLLVPGIIDNSHAYRLVVM